MTIFDSGQIPVNSSNLRSVGYGGGTLRVVFHTGKIYDHPNVPYHVYLGLMQASSMGAYYSRNIRGKYR